jgi:hypothetical protein
VSMLNAALRGGSLTKLLMPETPHTRISADPFEQL